MKEIRHGTIHGYINQKCRCEQCREAQRLYCAERRRLRRLQPPPEGVKHGSSTYTNWGCRCDVCRAGWNAK